MLLIIIIIIYLCVDNSSYLQVLLLGMQSYGPALALTQGTIYAMHRKRQITIITLNSINSNWN